MPGSKQSRRAEIRCNATENIPRLEFTVASQRRQQIVEAARACLVEVGVNKTTMRNVAIRAGVSHSTIAYYFKSRKRLVDTALLAEAKDYIQRLPQGSKPDSLAGFIERFLDRTNQKASFVVELLDAGLHNAEFKRAHVQVMEAGGGWVEAVVRRGMESGDYRIDMDPQFAAAAFHGALLWVGFQLHSGIISHERAVSVATAALKLLEPASTEGWSPNESVTAASGSIEQRTGLIAARSSTLKP